MMTTLIQNTLNFNKQIKMSDDGGSLSSDSGQFFIREFDEKLRFSKTIDKHLTLNDDRLYYKHSNTNILRQKIYQIISGHDVDSAAKLLTDDPVFTHIVGTEALDMVIKNLLLTMLTMEKLDFIHLLHLKG